MTLFYVRQNKISAELRHKYYALGTNSSKKKLHILIGKEGRFKSNLSQKGHLCSSEKREGLTEEGGAEKDGRSEEQAEARLGCVSTDTVLTLTRGAGSERHGVRRGGAENR